MSNIILENMEFHAFHGCLEHEQQLGNTFIVSICLELDTTLAGKTDELGETLNYQLVYDVVKAQMEVPSKLIEHVGQRILDHIFNEFPQVRGLEVRLSKMNPPLGGKVDRVTIELGRKR
ncbi:MAG: dihydroneopterin aldolase [Bacteroidota bacterium]|nr:dihydroneopterin aldolase [Bacteroidota bacterium]